MSKQSVYTVHSGDECGGDPCYNVLKGPAGFECWLTEPEDRSFWRDLAPVVERLEHLEQSNAQLREQNRVLREVVDYIKQRCEPSQHGGDHGLKLHGGILPARIAAALTATSQPQPPYKEWCRHPEKCAGLASCPQDPTCAD